jgi:hypothetical protein
MTFAVEAGGSKPNEDWTGISADTMLVLDGVTVPAGIETGCIHGTPWYVESLGRAILRLCDRDSEQDLRAILSAAISTVNADHEQTCDIDAPGTPAATVAMFRARSAGYDYLVLSDAFLVAETLDGELHVVTDRTLDALAVVDREAVYRRRIGAPEHTAALLRMVRSQMALRNRPGGYWVAASDPSAADHAITGHFASGEVKRAAVLTDGAARLADPFQILDWRQLIEVVTGSPQELITRTRSFELMDPHGEKWPRYKTSDDAAVAFCDLRASAVPEKSESLQPSMSSVL